MRERPNASEETEKSQGAFDRARLGPIKRQLHERLITALDLSVVRTMPADELRAQLRRGAEEICGSRSELLSRAERDRLVEELLDETLGLGPLETLMRDPTVSDILTTIHANDARDAIARLEMLVGMSDVAVPLWFIHRQIASAIQIVVQTTRLMGGPRKIVQISEITGRVEDTVAMHDIFVFEQTGVDERRVAQGHFVATGIRPSCLERLDAAGFRLPPGMFERRRMNVERVDALEHSRAYA
jgi:pilus assembly protein CpaF